MKKLILAIIFMSLTINLLGCNNNENNDLKYVIDNDIRIEVIYYKKFSEDQNLSHYDVLQLNMTGEELIEYSFFKEIINQAEKTTYDYSSIILGVPIGWYEIKFFNDNVLDLGLRFKPIENQKLEVEIYSIEDNVAIAKYTTQITLNEEVVNFMDFIQNNGRADKI